jgi:hypothetical protein
VKRSAGGSEQAIFSGGSGSNDSTFGQIIFANTDTIRVNGYSSTWRETSQVFRDYSAWYHIVVAFDTTLASAGDRVKLYVNGAQVTAFSQTYNPTQNTDYGVNQAAAHNIGKTTIGSGYLPGYLADIHFIDGQALDPTSFGEFDDNGIWQPKAYSGGSYGTNGFHLDFSNNSTAAALGTDTSGQGNTWSVNNISVAAGSGNDSLVDVPTNGTETDTGVGNEVRGNYCTLNALDKGSSVTLTNGNLDIAVGGSHNLAAGTIMISSGKYYAEFVATSLANGISCLVGVCNPLASRSSYLGGTNGGVGYGFAGDKWVDGSVTGGQTASAVGDVIGIALDKDNNEVKFYKNNTLILTQTGLNTSQPYTFAMGHQNCSGTFNFGQRPFAYTAPSGFKALNTASLPAPVVTKPSTVMDVLTWTGNGSSPRTFSGLNFSPDFVWVKSRSNSNWWHQFADVIRGGGVLFSNSTSAEYVQASNIAGYVSAYSNDGFTATAGNSSINSFNATNDTYVAWAWDAGNSTVTNTQGSITSSVRANASAGFSIVTYTGTGSAATVGHGLNAAPGMIVVKSRSNTMDWGVYHSSLANTQFLKLNTDGAPQSFNAWNSTSPTSTVFSIGNIGETNTNTYTYVAYCFAPVSGYSAMGRYTGNGSADGPFVYTGFRPKWLLIKRTQNADGWLMLDAARNPYNVADRRLEANSSGAETDSSVINVRTDFCSNGFKLRGTWGGYNQNGEVFLYAAFAESPFQYARAR